MATKSSTSLALSFLFIVVVIASYSDKAKADYEIARGPIVSFGCNTDADCGSNGRSMCLCPPCQCNDHICQCCLKDRRNCHRIPPTKDTQTSV
ncbi:hypothetical protein M5689_022962 [Euphorbia peplus]|nr:hypothetical protein M5689_022962 [Euphorbia peplus]